MRKFIVWYGGSELFKAINNVGFGDLLRDYISFNFWGFHGNLGVADNIYVDPLAIYYWFA